MCFTEFGLSNEESEEKVGQEGRHSGKTIQAQKELIATLQAQLAESQQRSGQSSQQASQQAPEESSWSQQKWSDWKGSSWWDTEESPTTEVKDEDMEVDEGKGEPWDLVKGMDAHFGALGLTDSCVPVSPEPSVPEATPIKGLELTKVKCEPWEEPWLEETVPDEPIGKEWPKDHLGSWTEPPNETIAEMVEETPHWKPYGQSQNLVKGAAAWWTANTWDKKANWSEGTWSKRKRWADEEDDKTSALNIVKRIHEDRDSDEEPWAGMDIPVEEPGFWYAGNEGSDGGFGASGLTDSSVLAEDAKEGPGIRFADGLKDVDTMVEEHKAYLKEQDEIVFEKSLIRLAISESRSEADKDQSLL